MAKSIDSNKGVTKMVSPISSRVGPVKFEAIESGQSVSITVRALMRHT